MINFNLIASMSVFITDSDSGKKSIFKRNRKWISKNKFEVTNKLNLPKQKVKTCIFNKNSLQILKYLRMFISNSFYQSMRQKYVKTQHKFRYKMTYSWTRFDLQSNRMTFWKCNSITLTTEMYPRTSTTVIVVLRDNCKSSNCLLKI